MLHEGEKEGKRERELDGERGKKERKKEERKRERKKERKKETRKRKERKEREERGVASHPAIHREAATPKCRHSLQEGILNRAIISTRNWVAAATFFFLFSPLLSLDAILC